MTIVQKQLQLQYLGYYTDKIDGKWGPNSKAATKAFQKANGLAQDGSFGPLTTAKSMEVIKGIQEAIGTRVDGYAGPMTTAATIEYQKANGLEPDGIAGPKTRDHIENADMSWWDDIKYFDRSEFKCKCGGKYCDGYPAEPNKKLVQTADRVREHFGVSIRVSSGVRCDKHNAKVGGVPHSRHRLGRAMDFYVYGKSAAEVLAYVKKQPEIRYAYAIDKDYVHMDIGN